MVRVQLGLLRDGAGAVQVLRDGGGRAGLRAGPRLLPGEGQDRQKRGPAHRYGVLKHIF